MSSSWRLCEQISAMVNAYTCVTTLLDKANIPELLTSCETMVDPSLVSQPRRISDITTEFAEIPKISDRESISNAFTSHVLFAPTVCFYFSLCLSEIIHAVGNSHLSPEMELMARHG